MFKQLTTMLLNRPQIREQWEKMTDYDRVNINNNERTTSLVLGGTTLMGGLSRPFSLRGALSLTAGGYMLYRGLRGHCPLYDKVGYNSLTDAEREQLQIERDKRMDSQNNGAVFSSNATNKVDEQLLETFPASDAPATY